MATAVQNQEGLHKNLRKQLAVAVRSIQWSYAIFWSLSTTQQGALEWSDGYYNGDIKTRKTVSAMEINADKIGSQRSEQLRELYQSLLEGETEQQQPSANKRPSAALSPEDLTDAEWYYLVCMSFVFGPSQGLPGRAMANGETIWLCNAQHADSKVFSRSLLAKSASIQTVVCFPHLNGVVELGVTELIPEDSTLLQHIKASLLDFSKPDCCEQSSPPNAEDDNDPMCMQINQDTVDTLPLVNPYFPTENINLDGEAAYEINGNQNEELHMESLDECSKGCDHNHHNEDSFMLDGISNGEASWHFIEGDLGNDLIADLMNSSDCISEAFTRQAKPLSSPRRENTSHVHLKDLQEGNHTKLSSLDLGADDDDLHYRKTLSNIFGCSNRLKVSLYGVGGEYKSSFEGWKKGETADGHKLPPQVKQKILKKILFTVPLLYGGCTHKTNKEICRKDALTTMIVDDFCKGNVSSYKKENEKFMVLRSMVPSISEVDKASILNDAIKYLKKLEARVEELESCMGSIDSEARPRRNYTEMVEQISDNYDNRNIDNGKRTSINKRKATDIDEMDPEMNTVGINSSLPFDVKLSIKEKEVVIDMRCQYREFILLDILDAINNLHLDAYSVQSSNIDGLLTLAIKSKFRGAAVAPAAMIKQALRKIA